jgi:hypothetical protein
MGSFSCWRDRRRRCVHNAMSVVRVLAPPLIAHDAFMGGASVPHLVLVVLCSRLPPGARRALGANTRPIKLAFQDATL